LLNADTGYVAGSNVLLKTVNGGATWTTVSSGQSFGSSMRFVNAIVGFASGTGGVILKTVNGGASWGSQQATGQSSVASLDFPEGLSGYACAGRFVMKHVDTLAGTSVRHAAKPQARLLNGDRLGFTLAASTLVRIRITDLSGRELFRKAGVFPAREHILELPRSSTPSRSLNILEFQAGSQRQTLLLPGR
jgi:hypothetical protein